MSAKTYRRARQRVEDYKSQVLRLQRLEHFRFPLWRLIVGIVFPSVKTRYVENWDRFNERAFAKTKKMISHQIARGEVKA